MSKSDRKLNEHESIEVRRTTQSSADMTEFLEYTNQVVWKGLERYLYQVQQKELQEHETQKLHEMNNVIVN